MINHNKKKIKLVDFCIIIFASLIGFGVTNALAITSVPDKLLKIPALIVLRSGTNEFSGTGFFYRTDKKLYLVTAKHVLFDKDGKLLGLHIDEKGKVSSALGFVVGYSIKPGFDDLAEMQLDLSLLEAGGHILRKKEKDVVAIEIATLVGVEHETISLEYFKGVSTIRKADNSLYSSTKDALEKYDETIISNDIFLLGFPTSLGIPGFPQLDSLKPLVRRGIVAGKNDSIKKLVLDCFAFHGNSGGPVIEMKEKPGLIEFKIIGILTEFVPYHDVLTNRMGEAVSIQDSNSGYSIAEPINVLLDLIGEK